MTLVRYVMHCYVSQYQNKCILHVFIWVLDFHVLDKNIRTGLQPWPPDVTSRGVGVGTLYGEGQGMTENIIFPQLRWRMVMITFTRDTLVVGCRSSTWALEWSCAVRFTCEKCYSCTGEHSRVGFCVQTGWQGTLSLTFNKLSVYYRIKWSWLSLSVWLNS